MRDHANSSATGISDIPSDLLKAYSTESEVNLLGRFMLGSGHEYPCQITSISPLKAKIIAPRAGDIDDHIVLYIDYLGRFEGAVSAIFEGGFELTLHAQLHKREKLAKQITLLVDENSDGMREGRRHERLRPDESASKLVLEDGRTFDVDVLDISLSGAAVRTDVRPAIGELVTVGKMHGRVVRHAGFGFAIELVHLQNISDLEGEAVEQPAQ